MKYKNKILIRKFFPSKVNSVIWLSFLQKAMWYLNLIFIFLLPLQTQNFTFEMWKFSGVFHVKEKKKGRENGLKQVVYFLFGILNEDGLCILISGYKNLVFIFISNVPYHAFNQKNKEEKNDKNFFVLLVFFFMKVLWQMISRMKLMWILFHWH